MSGKVGHMKAPSASFVNIKAGWLTSEFRGKFTVQLIAALVLFGIIPEADQEHAKIVSLGLIAALEAFYTLSRTIVKSASSAPTVPAVTPGPQSPSTNAAAVAPENLSFTSPK